MSKEGLRCFLPLVAILVSQTPPPATQPKFEGGLAQPVFAGQPIIRHNIWVEVPALHTDRDGALDRICVQIHVPTRPIMARSCRSFWSRARTPAG